MTSESPVLVLLIEDSDVDYEIFLSATQNFKSNLKIERVTTGETALEFLENRMVQRMEFPNLILLDLNLPGMSGLEFVQALRASEGYSSTPTIIISTSENPKDLRDAYDFGVNAYFKKPIRYEKFETVLKTIFDYWSMASVPKQNRHFGLNLESGF